VDAWRRQWPELSLGTIFHNIIVERQSYPPKGTRRGVSNSGSGRVATSSASADHDGEAAISNKLSASPEEDGEKETDS
jgi:hypothetical protein